MSTAAAVPSPTGRQTILVALGSGSVMLFGAALAVLIAQLFGKNADTDAFFAAYGCYTVGLTFGGTFRLTAIPRLVNDEDGRASTRMLGAVGLMVAGLAVPMVLLAAPLGTLLVAHDPNAVAETALRILWVALAAQVLTALLAAILAVRGQFVALGLAMLFAGAISLPLFLATEGAAGVQAAAIAVAAGGLWQVAVSLVALRRRGWHPHRLAGGARAATGQVTQQAGYLLAASTPFIGSTLAYVICVAVASREGAGDATLFAYAFVTMSILLGLTANVSAQVRSPSVIASRNRTAGAADASVWTVRFTLLLCLPVLVLAWLVGAPVIGFVLGSDFSNSDVTAILVTIACLTGWLLASATAIFAIVELLAAGALRALAAVAGVQVLATAALAVLGAQIAGIAGIGAALALTQLAASGVQLHLAFGPGLPALLGDLGESAMRALVVAVVMAVPAAALLLVAPGTAGTIAAGLLAAGLAAAATVRAWPEESRSLLGVFRRAA